MVEYFKQKTLAVYKRSESRLHGTPSRRGIARPCSPPRPMLATYRQENGIYQLADQINLLLRQRIEIDTSLKGLVSRVQELQGMVTSLKAQRKLVPATIPLYRGRLGSSPAAGAPGRAAASRVLLVHELPEYADLLSTAFDRIGFESAVCRDSVEALDVLEEDASLWDALIADAANSTGLLRHAKLLRPDLLCVVCDEPEQAALAEAEADLCWPRPTDARGARANDQGPALRIATPLSLRTTRAIPLHGRAYRRNHDTRAIAQTQSCEAHHVERILRFGRDGPRPASSRVAARPSPCRSASVIGVLVLADHPENVIERVGGVSAMYMDDRFRPLVSLKQALCLDTPADHSAAEDRVVVLRLNGQLFGLLVEEVREPERRWYCPP
ncbi:MAG: chemotaxis protein CheW [Pseudomonadota bacterium]